MCVKSLTPLPKYCRVRYCTYILEHYTIQQRMRVYRVYTGIYGPETHFLPHHFHSCLFLVLCIYRCVFSLLVFFSSVCFLIYTVIYILSMLSSPVMQSRYCFTPCDVFVWHYNFDYLYIYLYTRVHIILYSTRVQS